MELAVQQIINALSLGSIYALVALGVAIVFSILRLANFAHGELVTVSGYTLYLTARDHAVVLRLPARGCGGGPCLAPARAAGLSPAARGAAAHAADDVVRGVGRPAVAVPPGLRATAEEHRAARCSWTPW